MSNRWVVNASPVILLAKVGRIDLLAKLTERLIIPFSVAAEINKGPAIDPARQWIAGDGTASIVSDPEPVQQVSAWDLGNGEMAVLTWAFRNKGYEVIIDDRAARKCANVLAIPFRGTLGVILTARMRGLIPAARPVCEDLIHAGLLIDKTVVRDALRLVGE